MTSSIFPGPIAPENNPPINPQYYQPRVFFISALVLGQNTTVTTTVNHNYVVGQTIRLLIPPTFGSFQLNGQQGEVIMIPTPNQVTVNINSTNANAFIASPAFRQTPAQIIAIGDVNSGIISSTGRSIPSTNIPGAFINISPI